MSVARYTDYADSGIDWLGDLPDHWTVKPIKAVSTLNDEVLSEAAPPNFEIEYVEISDVAAGAGITGSSTLLFMAAPSRARRRVRDGDIIISTVRTYLRAIASIETPPDNMVVSTGFAVIRPRTVDPKFLAYTLEMEGFINQVIARSVGVSYPAINASDLVCLPVPVPSGEEQTAIAAFLDRETGKIAALVEAQRQLIDLLKEKRQAVISHAVTKGLDPTAPMKDSGVDWLGEVPAHWEVKPLRHGIRRIDSGTSVNAVDAPAGEGEKGVLKTSCVYTGEFDASENKAVVAEELDRVSCPVVAGALIVSRMNTPDLVGAAGLVTDDHPNIYLPDRLWQVHLDTIRPKFAHYWMQSASYRAQVKVAAGGTSSSMQNLGQDRFRGLWLAWPPAVEQAAIEAHIQMQVAKLRDLEQAAVSAIHRLRERREALISAAVTGKIDVRGHGLPTETWDRAAARCLVGAAVLELVADSPASGRMTSAKRMYLAEAHAGVWELQGNPQRMAAGPFDSALMAEVEAELARVEHISTSQTNEPNGQVHYRLTGARGALRADLDALLGDRRAAFDKMLADLGELESKGVEAVATLYAVWNDMLIDGKTPTDDAVTDGVLNDWHAEKRDKFTKADLRNYLGWMRRHGMTPTGRGPRTKSGALL